MTGRTSIETKRSSRFYSSFSLSTATCFHVVSPRASKPARLHFLSVHLILSPTYWRFYHAAIRDLPVARTSKYVHPAKPKFRVEFTSVPPIIAENSTNETSVSNNKIIIIQFITIKLYVKLE